MTSSLAVNPVPGYSAFQKACLRFLRKHPEISAAQMFLMWRHAPRGSSLPEFQSVSNVVYGCLPVPPAPNALFSNDEIAAVVRLSTELPLPHRFKGYALINLAVWERIFPEDFKSPVAGSLLKEAHDCSLLSEWVGTAFRADGPYHAAVFDLTEKSCFRITLPVYADDKVFADVVGRPFQGGAKKSRSHVVA